ncbi:hypothetical protein AKJ57_02915 [candidate division MSBL1 archaeon SCGC-AAA259A05]|uniref:Uncharacterized protein n=1 Tax=candidate division MSBL1 archaeon SCGC-AAA259A05 TaxID=1698259 RepID=A0A133U9V1_9EURY|nr:hypothetical protein AKJ57_02915 [candidate division MSBL1 archaeon SCGC-AAA259A05]
MVNEPRPEGWNHELWTDCNDYGDLVLEGLYCIELAALTPDGKGNVARTLVRAGRPIPGESDGNREIARGRGERHKSFRDNRPWKKL